MFKAIPRPLPGPLVPPPTARVLSTCPSAHHFPPHASAPRSCLLWLPPCLVPRERPLPGRQRQGSQSLRLKCTWGPRLAGPRVAVFQDAGPTLTHHTFWAGCQGPGSEQDPAQKMGLGAGHGIGGPMTTPCAAGLVTELQTAHLGQRLGWGPGPGVPRQELDGNLDCPLLPTVPTWGAAGAQPEQQEGLGWGECRHGSEGQRPDVHHASEQSQPGPVSLDTRVWACVGRAGHSS